MTARNPQPMTRRPRRRFGGTGGGAWYAAGASPVGVPCCGQVSRLAAVHDAMDAGAVPRVDTGGGGGSTAFCSTGGQARRATGAEGVSGSGGRATGLAAPTEPPQSPCPSGSGTGRGWVLADTSRPEMAPTSLAALPRPPRTRRMSDVASPRPASTGVIESRTPFPATRRGSGVSQWRGASSATSPLLAMTSRSLVSTRKAGRSVPAPTRSTCPSHWMPSSRRSRHTSARGRGASGSERP